MAKFPDFIIIGSMKCGTTVLWRNLNKHPYIRMGKNPEDPKKTSTEIRFWNNGPPYRTWGKGIEWYKNLFSGECSGEKEAGYVYSKKTMQKIYDYIPDVKLILTIREPIDRAYSEYQMDKILRFKKCNLSFEKAVAKDKGYIERGKYHELIKNNVLGLFSKKQLYMVVQEKMKENTDVELNKIYEFLGVSEFHADIQKVKFSKRDKSMSGYRKWESSYPPLNNKIRGKMLSIFKEENEKLFEFLGYRILEWNRYLKC